MIEHSFQRHRLYQTHHDGVQAANVAIAVGRVIQCFYYDLQVLGIGRANSMALHPRQACCFGRGFGRFAGGPQRLDDGADDRLGSMVSVDTVVPIQVLHQGTDMNHKVAA
jgi:hypothetical protein